MAGSGCAGAETLWGTTVPNVCNQAALVGRRAMREGGPSRFGDAAVLIFLVAQCLDGIFTYVGVMTFGLAIEANPLVGGLMLHLGEGTGVLSAKVVASVLGIALHLRQVHGAVALLATFYMAVAIVPWSLILFL